MKQKIDAAIFDVDGLILDSECFYAQAWTDAFNSLSPKKFQCKEKTMKKWFYKNLSGKKIGNQIENIQKQFPNNHIPDIYEEYRKLFRARLITHSIKVRKGFFELLNYLKKQKTKLAIVSTSHRESIQKSLHNANIDISDFDIVVTGDLGLEFKPSPAPYLKACELLNVLPNNTITFEDSNAGVLSATAAGTKCFLVIGRAPVSNECKDKAFKVCKTLSNTINIIKKNFDF